MSPTIIRFPVAAKLGERPTGATPISLATRLKRWLFGHQRPLTPAGRKIQRARYGR